MKNLLLIIVLALGMLGGYIYYKTGKIPVRNWSEQLQHDGFIGTLKKISEGQFVANAKKIADDVTGGTLIESHPEKVQIYKWTDADGVVHYDNQPVKGAKELSINPNVNVMPMVDAPKPVTPDAAPSDAAKEMMENIEKMNRAKEAKLGI
jgi:hypothetical protein